MRAARNTSGPLPRDLHAICSDILGRLKRTKESVRNLFQSKGILHAVRSKRLRYHFSTYRNTNLDYLVNTRVPVNLNVILSLCFYRIAQIEAGCQEIRTG